MERIKSVGEQIDELLAKQLPSKKEFDQTRLELANMGRSTDPDVVLITWATREITLGGKKDTPRPEVD